MRGEGWKLRGWILGLVAGALLVACEEEEPPRAMLHGDVPSGAFARVGDQTLPLSLLDGAADPKQRAEDLVADSLLALESERRRPHRAEVVRRGILARALLESLSEAALEEKPPTQQERAEVERELWQELDRPRAVRTGYAFVPFRPMQTGDAEFEYMEAVADAVQDLESPKRFAEKVRSVEARDFSVRLGQAPALTADGRIVELSPADETAQAPPEPYASRAARLPERGATSDVVATEEGLFVIVALEVVEPYRASKQERERRIRAAVGAKRAEADLARIKKRARATTKVTRSPKEQTLTQLALSHPEGMRTNER